jgi:hypothetical protein
MTIGEKILAATVHFKEEYPDVNPFDVCLGSSEFEELSKECGQPPPDKQWHYEAARYFYKGMRVRLMNTPGVLVGILQSKKPTP